MTDQFKLHLIIYTFFFIVIHNWIYKFGIMLHDSVYNSFVKLTSER